LAAGVSVVAAGVAFVEAVVEAASLPDLAPDSGAGDAGYSTNAV
jgi:hypothetical protein